MNINFKGSLTFDKSFYTLKQSDCKKIESVAKQIYETPNLKEVIPDTIIYGRGSKKGDSLKFKFGVWEFEIVTKGAIHPGRVIQQIMLNTCFYNGETPLSQDFKTVSDSLIKVVKKKLNSNN